MVPLLYDPEVGIIIKNAKKRLKNSRKQGAVIMDNKLLLVEDDEEIRTMIKDYLSGEFEIHPFCNGETLLRTISDYSRYSLPL